MSSRYDEESLRYAKERFSDKIEKMIKSMSLSAYSRVEFPFIRKYPIYKILTFVAKKLFLNCFELLLLHYVLG